MLSPKKDIVKDFIDMLKTVVPDLIAIYRFSKDIALFDPMLKNSTGYVIILDKKDYYIDNFLLIDLVFDRLQDLYGWPEGVRLANSFSRTYIRTPDNLFHINPLNNYCLLPEDMINLRNNGELIYGKDILKDLEFPHNDEDILKIGPTLLRKDVEELALKYGQYYPLVDPDCSWMRFPFVVEHPVIDILRDDLMRLSQGDKVEKHAHLYGRFFGSGKTQTMYGLIKLCKLYNIPFIYRTEFWKDENGKYIEEDYNPQNDPSEVANWVAEHAPGERFVLFLDECDIDVELLMTLLKDKFSNKDSNVFIISGAKEIPDFVDKKQFQIYDINKEYSFTATSYKSLLKKVFTMSNIDYTIFLKESMELIIKKTKLWFLSSVRSTPQAVIAAATLSLAEALKISEESNSDPVVFPDIAERWAMWSSSPWWQRFPNLRDTHAEFFVYDGSEYIAVDPHYKHAIP